MDHRLIANLTDPETVKAIVLDPTNRNPSPLHQSPPAWGDLSLANGYPSLLLLFSQLQKNNLIKEGEAVIHQYVLKIKEAIETQGISDLSLFGGVSGICFALKQASFNGTRYQRMLQTLHTSLLDNIRPMYLDPLRENRRQSLPSSPKLYDPIQGICGIGRYVVDNLSLPCFWELAQEITKVLVALSRPLHYANTTIPGWYLSPDDSLNAHNRSHNPQGNFNLGLAHGVTGILAFLSIAFLCGIDVEGQKEAIETIAQWLCQKSFMTHKGISWPYRISWEEEMTQEHSCREISRDAWCYGAPGIARTLFLAARASNNEKLKKFAVRSFCNIFLRSKAEWLLPGPSLCHGMAGLLLITHAMAKEEGLADLLLRVDELKESLLSLYRPDAYWGFKDVEPCCDGTLFEVHKAGFLEGASGVMLTLLTLSHSDNQWFLPLLIHA